MDQNVSDWIRGKLVNGEIVLHVFRHHWLWYARQILPCVLGIVAVVITLWFEPQLWLSGAIFIAIGLIIALLIHARWRKKCFIVTNQRIFYTGGLLNRFSRMDDLPLIAVGDIDADFTGWFGAIFGETDFNIQSGDAQANIELCSYPASVHSAIRGAQNEYNVNLHQPQPQGRVDALGHPY